MLPYLLGRDIRQLSCTPHSFLRIRATPGLVLHILSGQAAGLDVEEECGVQGQAEGLDSEEVRRQGESETYGHEVKTREKAYKPDGRRPTTDVRRVLP